MERIIATLWVNNSKVVELCLTGQQDTVQYVSESSNPEIHLTIEKIYTESKPPDKRIT